jgi:hypothetical protein
MCIYYIYAYLRKDGTPSYRGKGSGRRAWTKHKGIAVPIEGLRIVIMEDNLSNIGALALERFYIRWYGRKNTNTGILRNLTDGGEGTIGIVRSIEQRINHSKIMCGRKQTDAHKEKNRISNSGKNNARYGVTAGYDTLEKQRTAKLKEKNPMYGKKHPNNGIEITCSHCGKIGKAGGMLRWHFSNCKHQILGNSS